MNELTPGNVTSVLLRIRFAYEQYRDALVTLQLAVSVNETNRNVRRTWKNIRHRITADKVRLKIDDLMNENNPLEALQREVTLCAMAIEQTSKPR